MYRIGLLLVMVLAIALGVVIGTLNPAMVTVDLLWFQLDWPLGLSLIFVLVTGALLGLAACWLFVAWPTRVRLRRAEKLLSKQPYLKANGREANGLDHTDA